MTKSDQANHANKDLANTLFGVMTNTLGHTLPPSPTFANMPHNATEISRVLNLASSATPKSRTPLQALDADGQAESGA